MKTNGLANALIQAGKLSENDADRLVRKAQANGSNLVAAILAVSTLNSQELAQWISQTFGVPLIDLDAIPDANIAWSLLPAELRSTYKVVPLYKRGKRLMVATADPADESVADRLKFAVNLPIDFMVADYAQIERRILQVKSLQGNVGISSGQPEFDMAKLDVDVTEDGGDKESEEDSAETDDAPIVQYINRVISDALALGASDIHFEPFESVYQVRLRIDGELQLYAQQPPVSQKERISSRIKVVTKLDIAEKRVPQDGRMRLFVDKKRVDFRVSTLPTVYGEKIVMRVLDASIAQKGIDTLGYEPEEKARLMEAIARPYGMVLVTGPTGSGKTVSLYSCLNILNKPGVNISTAEDPVEINLTGINQVNVSDKAGLTFSTALRAFLRQDPDIIMVGEIRDLETADISIKAAQTGHMVFSTLHTNDAPTTLTRLMNMGVPTFNIASSVILITAQRLARKLCPYCKAPDKLAQADFGALLGIGFKEEDLIGNWVPYKAVGCDKCNRGYKGRVGLYQVMPISESIQRIILAQGSAMDIAEQAAKEGVRTLRQSGLVKIKAGLTSIEEVVAVTNL